MKLLYNRKLIFVILTVIFLTFIMPMNLMFRGLYVQKSINRFGVLFKEETLYRTRESFDADDISISGLPRSTITDFQYSSQANNSEYARRLPNAIIIGVKKCGTRALLEYLRLHPDVKAPGPEPHFFDRYYHLGFEWYREKMPRSLKNQITVEKTPRYFVSPETPARIHNMSSNIRLLLVVRDPVTRAISDFTQYMSKTKKNHTVSFQRKLFRRNGLINTKWSAINIGLYENHLRNWLKYFPLENIHIVDGENLIKNPGKELVKVQDFLRLEHKIPEGNIYMNVTRGFPCILTKNQLQPYKCFKNSKGRPHLHIDKHTMQIMHNFFKPYNEKFFNLVGKNFTW